MCPILKWTTTPVQTLKKARISGEILKSNFQHFVAEAAAVVWLEKLPDFRDWVSPFKTCRFGLPYSAF
jgi:hypothetical protein